MKFIDLGLPSGTLWADINIGAHSIIEIGTKLDFFDALKVGSSVENHIATLPSLADVKELITYCSFKHMDNEYRYLTCVTGPNGNRIALPKTWSHSRYWTKTIAPSNTYDHAFELYINGEDPNIFSVNCSCLAWIRLVAKSNDCL